MIRVNRNVDRSEVCINTHKSIYNDIYWYYYIPLIERTSPAMTYPYFNIQLLVLNGKSVVS